MLKVKKCALVLAGMAILWGSGSLVAMEKQLILLRGVRGKIKKEQKSMREAKTLADVRKRYNNAITWLNTVASKKISQANINRFSDNLKKTYGEVATKVIKDYPKKWMKTLNALKKSAEQRGSEKVISMTDRLEKGIESLLAGTNQLMEEGIIPKDRMGDFVLSFNKQATNDINKMRKFIEKLKKKEKKHPETLESKILKKLVEEKRKRKEKTRVEKVWGRQEIGTISSILKEIRHYLEKAGYMLIGDRPQYDEKSVNKLGQAVDKLEKLFEQRPKDKDLKITLGVKKFGPVTAWKKALKNIIKMSKEWHTLFSGGEHNDPDFRAREVSLRRAQRYGGAWYYDGQTNAQTFKEQAKQFENIASVQEHSTTLQSTYKLMLLLLKGVYYTVGAPAGGLSRIGRYFGLYNWPAFKLKKKAQ